ncbi:hypothetical protein F4778DRAFT_776887 [Xylariomycetidae sp. FL2044]|nr:hypothetical protein F4778DRAFT_776887 [Xylariomycetidae sp. FL2044]
MEEVDEEADEVDEVKAGCPLRRHTYIHTSGPVKACGIDTSEGQVASLESRICNEEGQGAPARPSKARPAKKRGSSRKEKAAAKKKKKIPGDEDDEVEVDERRRAKSLDSAHHATQASARQIQSLAGHYEASASTISTAALKKRGHPGQSLDPKEATNENTIGRTLATAEDGERGRKETREASYGKERPVLAKKRRAQASDERERRVGVLLEKVLDAKLKQVVAKAAKEEQGELDEDDGDHAIMLQLPTPMTPEHAVSVSTCAFTTPGPDELTGHLTSTPSSRFFVFVYKLGGERWGSRDSSIACPASAAQPQVKNHQHPVLVNKLSLTKAAIRPMYDGSIYPRCTHDQLREDDPAVDHKLCIVCDKEADMHGAELNRARLIEESPELYKELSLWRRSTARVKRALQDMGAESHSVEEAQRDDHRGEEPKPYDHRRPAENLQFLRSSNLQTARNPLLCWQELVILPNNQGRSPFSGVTKRDPPIHELGIPKARRRAIATHFEVINDFDNITNFQLQNGSHFEQEHDGVDKSKRHVPAMGVEPVLLLMCSFGHPPFGFKQQQYGGNLEESNRSNAAHPSTHSNNARGSNSFVPNANESITPSTSTATDPSHTDGVQILPSANESVDLIVNSQGSNLNRGCSQARGDLESL